jgi:hypothetical protein
MLPAAAVVMVMVKAALEASVVLVVAYFQSLLPTCLDFPDNLPQPRG